MTPKTSKLQGMFRVRPGASRPAKNSRAARILRAVKASKVARVSKVVKESKAGRAFKALKESRAARALTKRNSVLIAATQAAQFHQSLREKKSLTSSHTSLARLRRLP